MLKTELNQPMGDSPRQPQSSTAQKQAARALWLGILSPLLAPILAPYAIAYGLRARSGVGAQSKATRSRATLGVALGSFWLLVVVLSAVVPPSGAFTTARLAVIFLHMLLVGVIFNRLEKAEVSPVA